MWRQNRIFAEIDRLSIQLLDLSCQIQMAISVGDSILQNELNAQRDEILLQMSEYTQEQERIRGEVEELAGTLIVLSMYGATPDPAPSTSMAERPVSPMIVSGDEEEETPISVDLPAANDSESDLSPSESEDDSGDEMNTPTWWMDTDSEDEGSLSSEDGFLPTSRLAAIPDELLWSFPNSIFMASRSA